MAISKVSVKIVLFIFIVYFNASAQLFGGSLFKSESDKQRDKKAETDRSCYDAGCVNLFARYQYLSDAKRLTSDDELNVANKLINCPCLESYDVNNKGLIAKIKNLVENYKRLKSDCNLPLCDSIVYLKGRNSFLSYSHIANQSDYELSKKIVDNCDCWTASRGDLASQQFKDAFKAMRVALKAFDDSIVAQAKLDEENQKKSVEEQKQLELSKAQQAKDDSLKKAEMINEINMNSKKPIFLEDYVKECQDYEKSFGELDICTNKIYPKIKSLKPTQITSQNIADLYFSPITSFEDWYINGMQSGYVQIGGRISWVSGDLAEMDIGNRYPILIKFYGWVVREGVPITGYGKPIGNLNYTTAIGGNRTLPCLKLVWMYRPSLDKNE